MLYLNQMKRLGLVGVILLGFLSPAVYAAMPNTSTYQLQSYGFGSGGTAGSSTSTYSLEGISGEIGGQTAATSAYQTKPGFIESQQANVPKVTVTNPSNYYDKLKVVIENTLPNNPNNPTDALYAMQVCVGVDFTPVTLACSGTTMYVKSDHTLGTTLAQADYQNYAAWGSSSGINIIGLTSNTSYYVHAKAAQHLFNSPVGGRYTESGYGPSSNAATSGQQFSFCLYGNYSSDCDGNNAIAFGGLTAGNISNSSTNIGVDFATNANSGGKVYIYSVNGGLKSTHTGTTIISALPSADLSSASSGFGAQIATVRQDSGGPFSKVSPYDGSASVVGGLGTSVSEILTSSNPLVGGRAAIQLKAKPSTVTPAATDYTETLTVIAAAIF
jgi:hypothetical protein